jgi:16S rRNA (guanine527-N7)-methyltransferase
MGGLRGAKIAQKIWQIKRESEIGRMTEAASDWKALLAASGMQVPSAAVERLERHVELVARANRVCSLVSAGDLDRLWERHVVDALSLVPVIRSLGLERGKLLDVGSGGGFPALPVKVLLPGLDAVLLERSERKGGFLRRAVAALGLDGVDIVVGEFPRSARGIAPDLVTARAVENPRQIEEAMAGFLGAGQVYVCQSGQVERLSSQGFHVERVEDAWTNAGLRRGELHLVRRKE